MERTDIQVTIKEERQEVYTEVGADVRGEERRGKNSWRMLKNNYNSV